MMPDIIDLEQEAAFYEKQCQKFIIVSFEKIMTFDITQQQLDVAEAVRKNYQLFLV
ncbi:MAG: hypothetical protein IPM78_06550 [Moraxellaceae bacterium]|nr:hypothetical protein [Moraxellaceae bacterium]